jgi:hypothetical protein
MAVKRVTVIIPCYEFTFEAGTTHEAAAMAHGRLVQSKKPVYGTEAYIILVDDKVYRVPRAAAERWIETHKNPRSPADMVALKRWQVATKL